MNKLFKIGVRGHDVGELSTQEIIAYCKENSIDGLQLVINKTWPSLYEGRKTDEIIKNINELKDNNIEIFLMGCYFNPIHSNKTFLESEIKRVKYVNEIAIKTNCEYIGSETGSLNDDEWTYNPQNHTLDTFNKVSETLKLFEEDLTTTKFLIEPVFDHVIYDVNQLEKLHETLNQNFLTTLDICNLLNVENANDYENIFKDAIIRQRDNIKLLHLKNFNIIDGKKVGCELNKGLLDYNKILDILVEQKMTNVPVIIEELSGVELENSIKFIREMEKKYEN